jgi:hypothetical protein
MVMSFAGVGSEKDCAGEEPAAIVNYRPVLTSERASHINKPSGI